MAKVTKLTPRMLRRMVLQEKRKMSEVLETHEENSEKVASKTEEVPADELADSIEKDIDWIQTLKIKEAKLYENLKKIATVKRHLKKRIIKKL